MENLQEIKKGDFTIGVNAAGNKFTRTCIGFVVFTKYQSEGSLLDNQLLNKEGLLFSHMSNWEEINSKRQYVAKDKETALKFIKRHQKKHEFELNYRPYFSSRFH
jgi:hypothetical protein